MKDLILVMSMQLLNLSSFAVYSILGLTYTLEAAKKGSSTTVSGLVFAAYPCIVFSSSPFIGKYLPKLGPTFVLFFGSLLEGASQIMFDFVWSIKQKWLFVLCSLLFRITAAVWVACLQTAIITISCVLYPDHVSLTFGILELAAGVGTMLGPFLGGVLYGIGGFKFPFIVIGVFVWIMLLAVVLILPKNKIRETYQEKNTGSVMQIVKIQGVAIAGICIVTAGILYSFFDLTIAVQLDHVTNEKFSKAQIGGFFLFNAGFYTVSAPICGYIVEHKMLGEYITIIGHCLAITTFSLMGPVPFLQPFFDATPKSIAISSCVLGISSTAIIIPTIGMMHLYAMDSGVDKDLPLTSISSGLSASALNIGFVIGPTFGYLLLQYSTFAWACLILLIVLLAEGIVLSTFAFYKRH